MTSKSVLAFVLVVLVTQDIPSALAEHSATETELSRSKGYEVLIEVPYRNPSVSPIPSVANKTPADSKYATTLVHFLDAAGERRFVISMSIDGSLDAQKLRLITKAKDETYVPGLSFSVSSKSGGNAQLITFIGRFNGDIRQLDRLLVVQMPHSDRT